MHRLLIVVVRIRSVGAITLSPSLLHFISNLGAPLLPYAESPPPSYDDVVNTPQRAVNSKPSAPPPEEIAHGPILPVARPGYDDHQSSERERNGEIILNPTFLVIR